MSLFPPGFAPKLLDDDLPWDQGQTFFIADFLQAYSLKDSYVLKALCDCAWENSFLFVIRFAPLWNPQMAAGAGADVGCWPLLVLQFPDVREMALEGFKADETQQRGIAAVRTKPLGNADALTTFTDHTGARITLLHASLIAGLCFDAEGKLLRLPL